jgi:hypothetical protein
MHSYRRSSAFIGGSTHLQGGRLERRMLPQAKHYSSLLIQLALSNASPILELSCRS